MRRGPRLRDPSGMESNQAPTSRQRHLLALALAAVPAATVAVASILDQSMRRPSLARLVVQSLQLSF